MTFKLSKNDTLIIKGIAILMIVFHNFFHFLYPRIGENEFGYSRQLISNLFSNIISEPINSIQFLSTYFGHYGVQLFIFLSGYGLTIAYGHKENKYIDFIIKRLIKIYPAFIIAIFLLLAYNYVVLDSQITFYTVKSVLLRLSLIANWIPGRIFSLSGPYWFYSMIVQLYLCFPLLVILKRKYNYGLLFVLLSSYLIIFLTSSYFLSIQLSLYYNLIGNLPVFVLGMILAFSKNWVYPKWLWFLALFMFIIAQFSVYFWYFSQISFVMMMLPLIIVFINYFNNSIFNKFLSFVGGLSMYIFAVNGFMRWPWLYYSNDSSVKLYSYLYFFIFLILVFSLSIIVRKTEQYIMRWIKASIPVVSRYI